MVSRLLKACVALTVLCGICLAMGCKTEVNDRDSDMDHHHRVDAHVETH